MIALIACNVLEDEIALYGKNAKIATTKFLQIALHDRPEDLRSKLQAAINELDTCDDIETIVLVYGLCGKGTAGLRASRHPLVIPRAHDCITLFMGSKELYAEHQNRCPECYYFSPGWMREKRTPGPEWLEEKRCEFSEKFDPEDVEFLLDNERAIWATRKYAIFLDLQTDNADEYAEKASCAASGLGWELIRKKGDPTLLCDLLEGHWDDERFLVVQPGETIDHSPDERILRIKLCK